MVLLKLCDFADDPSPYKTQLNVVLLKMLRQDSHEEFYKPGHIEYLNKNYSVFGMRYIDDNCHEYAFFDRDGNFGTIFFDQDGFEYFQRELNPMLKKSTASMTFATVVSLMITGQIEGVMQQLNDA